MLKKLKSIFCYSMSITVMFTMMFTMMFSKSAKATILTNQRSNIADLINDFGIQGNNGWYYGYGTSDSDFSLAAYDEVGLKYFQLGIDGFEIKSNFVHPAVSKGAIYKWVVGEDGKIDLTGKYTKSIQSDSNPSWPDGVKLKIYHNSQIIKEDVVEVSNTTDIIDNININKLDVKEGDNIYFIITANVNNAWDGGKLDININPVYDDQAIFPKSQQSDLSFVGDPMPYYENGKFNIFYLDDIRDSSENGFHPWSLLETDNFYDYTNEGIVINHSNSNEDQDLALGTGSVMKDKNGLYHAFFTGFNDRRTGQANEAIMHATSTDLKNWTKVYGDTFFASAQYSKNDFRDPYVFYNQDDNKYWMLITTRKDDTGVIAKYVSDDLKNWTDDGVFFTNDMNTSNLECPTLIKYGDYWYLTFSDQSIPDPYGNRVVHYRKANNLNEAFTKPERDSFDGNGFYAGKLEKDSDNNIYLFGWTPTKVNYNDSNAYDWAGNLVVHQIKQNTNGDLYATPVETVVNKINHSINLTEYNKTQTVTKNNNDYSFSGNGYESVTFSEINGTNKINGKISTKSKNDKFGFMFNVGDNGKAPLNIVFNHEFGRLEFYNISTDGSLGELESTKPITVADNGTLDFTILINDSVAVFYVNNEAAFSTRMYNIQNNKWGIFSMDSDVTFSNLQINK